MKHLPYIIFLWLALGMLHPGEKALAQDPHFTQFYAAPMYLAPSFAGATQQHRLSTNYRNQWPGIASFSTYVFSYDHYFDKFNSGLGMLILRDVAGAGNLGNLTAGLLYSYDFQVLEEWHVRPGVNFSFVQMGIDFHKLRFGDQISSEGTSPSTIEVFPDREQVRGVDFSSSLLVYTKRFWSGFTLDHMLEPNISLLGNDHTIPMKISLFGGYQLIRKGRLLKPIDETVSFAFLFKNQGPYNQLDMGLYWNKVPLVLGLWYRGIPPFNSHRGDALAALVGFKVKKFSVGYSYDFTISNLITHSNGSHEISMYYEFKTTRKKKYHAVPCPEF